MSHDLLVQINGLLGSLNSYEGDNRLFIRRKINKLDLVLKNTVFIHDCIIMTLTNLTATYNTVW